MSGSSEIVKKYQVPFHSSSGRSSVPHTKKSGVRSPPTKEQTDEQKARDRTDGVRRCGPAAAADRLQLEQAGVHRDDLPRHGHAAHRPAGRCRPGRPRDGPGARRLLEPSRRHQGSQARGRRARQRVQPLAGRPERPAIRRRLQVRRHPRLGERRRGCRDGFVRDAGSDPVHRALAADDACVAAAAVTSISRCRPRGCTRTTWRSTCASSGSSGSR